LKGGWLSGRYKRAESGPEAGSRVEWASKIGWTQTNYEAQANERTWRILDAVETIAKSKQVSMATVSLRWVIQRPGITSTIIGARTMAQLEENIQAGLISLTDEEMATLNQISEPHREYPYEVLPIGRVREGVHI
jgi:aryl-alcohol dehydrogenase-like predicted oxidoreductase